METKTATWLEFSNGEKATTEQIRTNTRVRKNKSKIVELWESQWGSAGRGGGGWAPDQIFKKEGGGELDRISIFRGGFLGKRGWFFSGGFQFLNKK